MGYIHVVHTSEKGDWKCCTCGKIQTVDFVIGVRNWLKAIYFISMTQQPKSGLGDLVVEVSKWYTIRHTHRHTHTHTHTHTNTHTVEVLWKRDQPVAATATYTTNNKHEGRTSMPSAVLQSVIPAIDRLQTHALDRTPPIIGKPI